MLSDEESSPVSPGELFTLRDCVKRTIAITVSPLEIERTFRSETSVSKVFVYLCDLRALGLPREKIQKMKTLHSWLISPVFCMENLIVFLLLEDPSVLLTVEKKKFEEFFVPLEEVPCESR